MINNYELIDFKVRMPESLGFYCGVCCGVFRIFCYNVCPFGKKRKEAYKPSYNVLCLGLSGAGKSTLLGTYLGDDCTNVTPTTGFNMKDVILETCTIHVKEIGGTKNIRQYWQHYFADNFQGLIFVLDSSCELGETIEELEKALKNPRIRNLPCLILATHQDMPNAKSVDDIVSLFKLTELCAGRPWAIHGCISTDSQSVRVGFEKLASLLWQDEP